MVLCKKEAGEAAMCLTKFHSPLSLLCILLEGEQVQNNQTATSFDLIQM